MIDDQESPSVSTGNLSWESNDTLNQLNNFPSTTLARQIFVVLFPCMVFIGVVCNTLIFVIMRRRRMSHLSTCYYMGILAIADTSVLLLGLSVMWLYLLDRKWSLLLQSTYVCKFVASLFYTISDVSVWLVCMMSADRCIAVTRPLHASSICTVRRARICACILVFCILLINVQFLFTHHLSVENECTYHEDYEFFSRHIWPWIDAAVYSVLPFILLLTMNLIIVHALFQARRSTTNLQIYQSQKTRQKNKLSTSMSRKLTTMLLAVTFFFLLSSFPMVCLQIYTNIHQKNFYNEHFIQSYLKPICETLQYSNHCINFFLYAITGKAFRHELKRLFSSMAIKMHLKKETPPPPPPLERRRTTAIQINDLPGVIDSESRRVLLNITHPIHGQTGTVRSSISAAIPCCRYRLSNESTTSDASEKRRTRNEVLVRPSSQQVTYCLQRISIV